MFLSRLWVLWISLAMVSAPNTALGQASPMEAGRFENCMALAVDSPKLAFEEAITWEGLGGGHAARYCAQTALMGLGRYREAGEGFERLAQAVVSEPRFKAELLANAAEARLLLGEAAPALALVDTALRLAPENPAMVLLRARVLADLGGLWEAIDDLDFVLSLEPKNVDALVYRASAYRHLDAHDLALADTERALEIEPDHAIALLERGNALRLLGRKDEARKSWLRLITQWPKGGAAVAARANLERMDLKAD